MSPALRRALVIGLGAATEPLVRALLAREIDVDVVEDMPSAASAARATRLGVELRPGEDAPTLAREVDVVLPSPMVAVGHPAIAAAEAAGIPVWSEFELAAAWDDRPTVAITGTNGKTTVTTLVEAMLIEDGRRAIACGNNDLPLIEAISDPATEIFVIEASSFRLEFTERFRPTVATWLNLSPDHLDWHPDLGHYARSKAKIWQAQRDGDVAIANAADPAVLGHLASAPAGRRTFGGQEADYRTDGGRLIGPGGPIVDVADLPRSLPHDLANALAACATAMEAGAAADACAAVLRSFTGLPHRVALVGDSGGVRWFDDSKATTPASVVTAVSAFDSVVLIAGGRNKGLDLGVLRDVASHLRAVVAIGEAAPIIEATFAGLVPVERASSMDGAVKAAADRAVPGDAVLLSPGCASYDWYRNYGERGDDFARAVAEVIA